MKLKGIISCLLIFMGIIATGQSSLLPVNPPSLVRGFTDQSVIQAQFNVNNTSNSNLNVMVKRRIIVQIPGTTNNFCWGIFCYPDNISESPTPSLIPANSTDTTFRGDYNPLGMVGITTIMYTFFDENNPSDSVSVTIDFEAISPPAIFGSLSYCSGDSAILNTQSNFSSYLWSNSETTNAIKAVAGSYWVDVILDAETRASDTVQIYQSSGFNPIINGSAVYCENDSVVLDAGMGFDHYSWSSGDTVHAISVGAGTYTVTVTNNSGCTGVSNPFNVIENLLPSIPLISWNGSILSSSSADYYQWLYNGFVIYGENSQDLVPTKNGIYSVCVYDTTSWCFSCSDTLGITFGIHEYSMETLLIYPNPCDDAISISKPGWESLTIFDTFGRIVSRLYNISKSRIISVSTSQFATGVYYLEISSHYEENIFSKFCVSHHH